MICPKFFIHQDDYNIIITIQAPNADVKNTEVVYYKQTFLFVSNPYFLKLLLPKEVLENEFKLSDYNSNKSKFLLIFY